MEPVGFVAKTRRIAQRHTWMIPGASVLAGLLFVAGCLAFFSPRTFTLGVALFLAGSLLMLVGNLADVLVRRGR